MATQVNYSSLELIVAFLEFVNAIYLLAMALFMFRVLVNILSVQSYSTACILGVSSMHLEILFPDTMFCGSTFEFSSAPPCVSICLLTSETLGSTFTLLF